MNRARRIDLRRAISHPARRRALRRLHANDRPFSSDELARQLGLPVAGLDYHLRVLELYGATKSTEGQGGPSPTAARHQSVISDDRWIRTRLAETGFEDEAIRPGASRPR